jgi:hypothetical protein
MWEWCGTFYFLPAVKGHATVLKIEENLLLWLLKKYSKPKLHKTWYTFKGQCENYALPSSPEVKGQVTSTKNKKKTWDNSKSTQNLFAEVRWLLLKIEKNTAIYWKRHKIACNTSLISAVCSYMRSRTR